jgi:hypothetical protein
MRLIGLLVVIIIASFYYFKKEKQTSARSTKIEAQVATEGKELEKNINQEFEKLDKQNLERMKAFTEPENAPATKTPNENPIKTNKLQPQPQPPSEHLLNYKIEDGLAVVQGDVVIGEVSRDQLLKSLSGQIKEPTLKAWPTSEIPYYVQPNLPNPSRITEALSYFAGTNIHFVPYTNQADALVFQLGQSNCRSYLGYVGGRQPIFLSEGCYAQEIAHEIMHALGFLHEQNRSDRDSSVDILWSNIDPQYNVNFEKFSDATMKLSGLSSFDFQSIMLYPPKMFSSNNQQTMLSKVEGQTINPGQGLSVKDIERLNKNY